ncbi:stress protein [Paenibacillus sp. ACRRY]|uniref:stress protein n=1 Tax=Paenibacillus sp. ACRRY TaxID=2918208 RepID=UPI001EF54D9B|nr:stress protein [Paenibacillus sp. ACRRY]MCG7386021.1 stress protein [Paenibacillus sp. ACRRY]
MSKYIGLFFLLGLILSITAACSSSESESAITLDDIFTEFQAAGLEIEAPTESISEEHGFTNVGFKDVRHISVPALGEGEGGYLFLFENNTDLEKLKDFYEEPGKSTLMPNSHAYAQDNILLQMSDQMSQTEFERYVEVIKGL